MFILTIWPLWKFELALLNYIPTGHQLLSFFLFLSFHTFPLTIVAHWSRVAMFLKNFQSQGGLITSEPFDMAWVILFFTTFFFNKDFFGVDPFKRSLFESVITLFMFWYFSHKACGILTPCVLCFAVPWCPTLCDPMDCGPPGSSAHGDSPGKNTGVGCHASDQGSNPHYLH